MRYYEVAEARRMKGVKLVLTADVPAPWSESAKSIFYVKKIDYIPVRQEGMAENTELKAWTGYRNAPILVRDDGPPLERWLDIAMFAERTVPEPALFPRDPAQRALAVGLSNEICGERGLGWAKRLVSIAATADVNGNIPDSPFTRYYNDTPAALAEAPRRIADILTMLAARVKAQDKAGSRYLVGDALSIADIYLANFLNIYAPMPHDQCPMPDIMRQRFTPTIPEIVTAASDPALASHRDHIFAKHLKLPMSF